MIAACIRQAGPAQAPQIRPVIQRLTSLSCCWLQHRGKHRLPALLCFLLLFLLQRQCNSWSQAGLAYLESLKCMTAPCMLQTCTCCCCCSWDIGMPCSTVQNVQGRLACSACQPDRLLGPSVRCTWPLPPSPMSSCIRFCRILSSSGSSCTGQYQPQPQQSPAQEAGQKLAGAS